MHYGICALLSARRGYDLHNSTIACTTVNHDVPYSGCNNLEFSLSPMSITNFESQFFKYNSGQSATREYEKDIRLL